MTTIGTVASLWRYPVKSMQGEELSTAFMGFSGFYGDRCYAFRNSAARKGTPYLTASTQPKMLQYRPQFRFAEEAAKPPNLLEAMSIAPGITPANPQPNDMIVDVITPSGSVVAIEDPALLEMLREGLRGEHHLTLVRSDRALTDCRPISLIGTQTIAQLEGESNVALDKRRFRANIYLELASGRGFAEDALIGRRLRIGSHAQIMVIERDPRCMMVSLDPQTGEHNPQVLRHIVQAHDNLAGVYGAVLVEGLVGRGDSIELLP